MMAPLQLLLAVLIGLLELSTAQQTTCIQGQNCHLPDCFCPTFKHPNFSNVKDIPQMVYFGFDDALTITVSQHYKALFDKSRQNPNGCPISMSLYVQDQYTSYKLVNDYYKAGFEIGSHSVTHTNVDDRQKIIFEAGKQKDNLTNVGNVPRNEIVGWRSPNLKPAGDAQPEELQKLGYTYDISLTYTRPWGSGDLPWPFTLDYGYPYQCSVTPCPTSKHPGFWEIPVPSLFDPENQIPCAYVDSCRPSSEAAAFNYLWSNFQQAYSGNRAPFGLNMHAGWFFFPGYVEATHKFLNQLLQLNDVYIISAKQVLDWMRNPVKVSEIHKLREWGCGPQQENPRPDPVNVQTTPARAARTTTVRPAPATFAPLQARPQTALPPWVWWMTPRNVTPQPRLATTQPPSKDTTTFPPATASPRPMILSFTVRTIPPLVLPTLTPSQAQAGNGHNSNSGGIGNSLSTTAQPKQPEFFGVPPAAAGIGEAATCVQEVSCKSPACSCRSLAPPGGLPVHVTPQIIYLTFSGGVDAVNFPLLNNLLAVSKRRNPNGCPITATFFLAASGGQQLSYVQALRRDGHEVASYGRPAVNGILTGSKVAEDLVNFNALLNETAVIGQDGTILRGYRSPAGNVIDGDVFQTLVDNGVLYDSSLLAPRTPSADEVNSWPYTLDFGWQDCSIGSSCPKGRYASLWELPLVPLVDYKQQFVCVYADSCYNHPPTTADTYNFLQANLKHAMDTNRAPLGIHLRKEWFSHPFYTPNLRGLELFLDSALATGDVFVLSASKVLDFIKAPVPLTQASESLTFRC